MFLDDENLPLLPEWEDQIKQLEQIRTARPQDAADDCAGGGHLDGSG